MVQQNLIKAYYRKLQKSATMSNDELEELKMKIVSTIHVSLALGVSYSVLNETSPQKLWKKLEKIYM